MFNYRNLWVIFCNNVKIDNFYLSIGFAPKYKLLSNFFSNLKFNEIYNIYLSNNMAYTHVQTWVTRNIRTKFVYSPLLGFRWTRFILFSGLGYKRRVYRSFRISFNYTADRHWILYRFSPRTLVGAHRRRNFVLFSWTKGQLAKNYNFFSSLRKPYVYKTKGFIDARVRGRFLFVRRIKIRGLRTKLSKKQRLL